VFRQDGPTANEDKGNDRTLVIEEVIKDQNRTDVRAAKGRRWDG